LLLDAFSVWAITGLRVWSSGIGSQGLDALLSSREDVLTGDPWIG
jgi:hypothetical protein